MDGKDPAQGSRKRGQDYLDLFIAACTWPPIGDDLRSLTPELRGLTIAALLWFGGDGKGDYLQMPRFNYSGTGSGHVNLQRRPLRQPLEFSLQRIFGEAFPWTADEVVADMVAAGVYDPESGVILLTRTLEDLTSLRGHLRNVPGEASRLASVFGLRNVPSAGGRSDYNHTYKVLAAVALLTGFTSDPDVLRDVVAVLRLLIREQPST